MRTQQKKSIMTRAFEGRGCKHHKEISRGEVALRVHAKHYEELNDVSREEALAIMRARQYVVHEEVA